MIPPTRFFINIIPSCSMMITANSMTHQYGIGSTIIQSAERFKTYCVFSNDETALQSQRFFYNNSLRFDNARRNLRITRHNSPKYTNLNLWNCALHDSLVCSSDHLLIRVILFYAYRGLEWIIDNLEAALLRSLSLD